MIHEKYDRREFLQRVGGGLVLIGTAEDKKPLVIDLENNDYGNFTGGKSDLRKWPQKIIDEVLEKGLTAISKGSGVPFKDLYEKGNLVTYFTRIWCDRCEQLEAYVLNEFFVAYAGKIPRLILKNPFSRSSRGIYHEFCQYSGVPVVTISSKGKIIDRKKGFKPEWEEDYKKWLYETVDDLVDG